MLNYTYEEKLLLAPMGNKTILLSPFNNEMLIEYNTSKLFDFLINRSISIHLRTDYGKVSFYIMNSTQFWHWKNGTTPYGELFEEQIDELQQIFVPGDFWKNYFLVLLNTNNITVEVDIKILDEFLVKVVDYGRPFAFLRIAFISAVLLFLLQIPLNVTIDDLILKVEARFHKRFKEYVVTELKGFRVLYAVNILIGLFCVIASVALSFAADRFTYVNHIWKDYIYRYFLTFFLLSAFLGCFLTMARMFWGFLYWPLTIKFYKNRETFLRYIKTYSEILKKLLVKPFSIIFYVCWLSVLCFSSLGTELGVQILHCIGIFTSGIYLGYNLSLAYFKTQQLVVTNFIDDLRYAKAAIGSTAIISIIAVYGLKAALPLLDVVFCDYVVGKSVLVSAARIPELPTARDIFDELNYLIPYVAYYLPLFAIVIYYSFAFFSALYMPKVFKDIDVSQGIRADLKFEIIFLFLVFSVSTWFESLFTTITPQKILLSLAKSFIATLFRSYLETLRRS